MALANGSSQVDPSQASVAVQLAEVRRNESAGEITPELPLRDEYENFHFELTDTEMPLAHASVFVHWRMQYLFNCLPNLDT
ncbi:hypothetical protein L3X38_031671 [Prunus dulcis]|uniref:Uncharacterized protein n=1 Tax=Prunus dulcis TaxID=3755 RepID=A0AAD4YVC8_PRUDU|nr:hypothetical protein L3X38_031671 [Prunus dulcis]